MSKHINASDFPAVESSSVKFKPTGKAEGINSKLGSIQILRAIAALLVVASHVQKEIGENLKNSGLDWLNIHLAGQFGVDIFFIISGFIMVYVTDKSQHTFDGGKDFFLKRLVRVVPLYWLMTIATIAMSVILPDTKFHNDMRPDYLVSSFFFIPFQRLDGHFTPALGVGWTLNYEILFYVLFTLVLFLPKKFMVVALAAIFLGMTIVGLFVGQNLVQLWYWTRPIILEFLLGGFIAMAMLRGVVIPYKLAVPLIIVGVAWWIAASCYFVDPTDSQVRLWGWGVPAALVTAGVILTPRPLFDMLPNFLRKLGERIGDGSYSLYIFHMFVVRGISHVLPRSLPSIAYIVLFFFAVIFLALICSDFLYRFVEKPLNNFGRRILHTIAPSARGL